MASRTLARAAVVLAVSLSSSSSLTACGDDPPDRVDPCIAAVARTTAHTPRPGELRLPTQCGPGLELTPINRYQGQLTNAQELEEAVVLINGSCTGTLIEAAAGPVVLTAGHCVGLGGTSLIVFNHEADPDGDPLITNGTVIERADDPDYALIELDTLPAIAPTLLTTRPSEILAIIQHPRGMPKSIAEGPLAGTCNGLVHYFDLDTLVGSSGAGVLTQNGYLLGIHTDGTCTQDGLGTNFGFTAARIIEVSSHLTSADLADR